MAESDKSVPTNLQEAEDSAELPRGMAELDALLEKAVQYAGYRLSVEDVRQNFRQCLQSRNYNQSVINEKISLCFPEAFYATCSRNLPQVVDNLYGVEEECPEMYTDEQIASFVAMTTGQVGRELISSVLVEMALHGDVELSSALYDDLQIENANVSYMRLGLATMFDLKEQDSESSGRDFELSSLALRLLAPLER